MPFTAQPSGSIYQNIASSGDAGRAIGRGIEKLGIGIAQGFEKRRDEAKAKDKLANSYRGILDAEGIEEIDGMGLKSAGLDLLEREATAVMERRAKKTFDAQELDRTQRREMMGMQLGEARDRQAGSDELGRTGQAISRLPQFSSDYVGPELKSAMRPSFSPDDLMTAATRDPRVAMAPNFKPTFEAAQAAEEARAMENWKPTATPVPGRPDLDAVRMSPRGGYNIFTRREAAAPMDPNQPAAFPVIGPDGRPVRGLYQDRSGKIHTAPTESDLMGNRRMDLFNQGQQPAPEGGAAAPGKGNAKEIVRVTKEGRRAIFDATTKQFLRYAD
jgi:hypothetical protein